MQETVKEQMKRRFVDLLFWVALLATGLWAYESFQTLRKVDNLMDNQCAVIEETVKENIRAEAVKEYVEKQEKDTPE